MSDDALPPMKKRQPNKGSYVPGQCGNRRGRPRGSVGIGARLKKAGARIIETTVRGRRRRLTLEDVASENVVAQMAKGDLKAFEFYLRETAKLAVAKGEEPQNVFPDLDRETKRIIAQRLLEEADEEEEAELTKERSGKNEDRPPDKARVQ